MKKIALIGLVLILFSCSRDKNTDLKKKAFDLYNRDKYNEADVLFQKIKTDTADYDFYYKRAVTKANLLEFQNSNVYYDYCILHKFRLEDSYLGKGANYFFTRNYITAIEYFKKVLSLNSKNKKAILMIEGCEILINKREEHVKH